MIPIKQSPKRILIVDDDLVFRDLVANSLMTLGYEVMMVAQMSQASTLVGQLPFDLLIIDGILPDGDGITLLRSIRAQMAMTPAYFVSAEPSYFADPALVERMCKDLKIEQFLEKPLDLREFLDTVHNALSPNSKVSSDSLPAVQKAKKAQEAKKAKEAKQRHPLDDVIESSLQGDWRDTQPEFKPPKIVPSQPDFRLPLFVDSSPVATNAVHSSPLLVQVNKLLEQKSMEYRPKLEDKLIQVGQMLSNRAHWTQDLGTLFEILNVLHKVKGTAGTYGFMTVSEECEGLEGLLKRFRDGEAADEALFASIEQGLETALFSLRDESTDPRLPIHQQKPTAGGPNPRATSSSLPTIPVSTPPPSLLSVRMLVYGMEQPLFDQLLPAAARHNIQLDLARTGDEVDGFLQETDITLMLFRLTPQENLTADEVTRSHANTYQMPMHVIPASVQIAQRVRRKNKFAPILFYGKELSLSKRILASHVKGSYYIEQEELETEFFAAVLALRSAMMREATILLLGDDQDVADAIHASEGLTRLTVTCMQADELFLVLENVSPELILVDAATLKSNATDVCRLLHTSLRWRSLPFFYVGDTISASSRSSALAAGAERVLPKSELRTLINHIRNRLK